MSKKLTTVEFIERAREVHGDRYDYSEVEYINRTTKVIILCSDHGRFEQSPGNHLSGNGCRTCGGKPLTNSQFQERARKVHGDKYDYSKVEYVNALTPVVILCPEHGQFSQKPAYHLNNNGCQACGGTTKMDTESFVAKARIVHGDKYDYSKVSYLDSLTKVTIICSEHGPFMTVPAKHLSRGVGCKKCSGMYSPTTDEFIERARKAHGKKYDYSKAHYSTSCSKVKIICPKHGEFRQAPANHIHGKQGCPKCGDTVLGKEGFVAKARMIHGDKHDYSKVEYVNVATPVNIVCPEHGVFSQTPNCHLSGSGCKPCGIELSSRSRAMTQDEFIAAAKKIHGSRYDYSEVDYEGTLKPVKIICKKHGAFTQRSGHHIEGSNCPLCSNELLGVKRRTDSAEFLRRAHAVHGDRYDYSKVKYEHTRKKVTIRCKFHGNFKQDPGKHLKGSGCMVCAADKLRSNKDEFIDKARTVHGERYDYTNVSYHNAFSVLSIRCPDHGIYRQKANSHLGGRGCPSCALSGFDPKKPAILYYLRLQSKTHTLWKIGITNQTVKKRFKTEDRKLITVVKIWNFNNGVDAYTKEQKILKKHAEARYNGIDKVLVSYGNTELFTRDVLGLDKDYT